MSFLEFPHSFAESTEVSAAHAGASSNQNTVAVDVRISSTASEIHSKSSATVVTAETGIVALSSVITSNPVFNTVRKLISEEATGSTLKSYATTTFGSGVRILDSDAENLKSHTATTTPWTTSVVEAEETTDHFEAGSLGVTWNCSDVEEATFEVYGAEGEDGSGSSGEPGGKGGYAEAIIDVSDFDELEIYSAEGRQGKVNGEEPFGDGGEGGGMSAVVAPDDSVGEDGILLKAGGGGGGGEFGDGEGGRGGDDDVGGWGGMSSNFTTDITAGGDGDGSVLVGDEISTDESYPGDGEVYITYGNSGSTSVFTESTQTNSLSSTLKPVSNVGIESVASRTTTTPTVSTSIASTGVLITSSPITSNTILFDLSSTSTSKPDVELIKGTSSTTKGNGLAESSSIAGAISATSKTNIVRQITLIEVLNTTASTTMSDLTPFTSATGSGGEMITATTSTNKGSGVAKSVSVSKPVLSSSKTTAPRYSLILSELGTAAVASSTVVESSASIDVTTTDLTVFSKALHSDVKVYEFFSQRRSWLHTGSNSVEITRAVSNE